MLEPISLKIFRLQFEFNRKFAMLERDYYEASKFCPYHDSMQSWKYPNGLEDEKSKLLASKCYWNKHPVSCMQGTNSVHQDTEDRIVVSYFAV